MKYHDRIVFSFLRNVCMYEKIKYEFLLKSKKRYFFCNKIFMLSCVRSTYGVRWTSLFQQGKEFFFCLLVCGTQTHLLWSSRFIDSATWRSKIYRIRMECGKTHKTFSKNLYGRNKIYIGCDTRHRAAIWGKMENESKCTWYTALIKSISLSRNEC